MNIKEFKEKYPKLISKFEKECNRHAIWGNKITKEFLYWLRQKITYKTLICPECNREFKNKLALSSHKPWHNKEFRENRVKAVIKKWQDPIFRDKMVKIRREREVKLNKLREY